MKGEYGPPPSTPVLLARVARRTIVRGGCLEWRGAVNHFGYGMIQARERTRNGKQKQSKLHNLIWTRLVGAIPAGLELDHTCFNKRCWNPAHLEPVTRSENSRRIRAREMALYGMPKAGRGRPLVAAGC